MVSLVTVKLRAFYGEYDGVSSTFKYLIRLVHSDFC
jgi:hypothetical protein